MLFSFFLINFFINGLINVCTMERSAKYRQNDKIMVTVSIADSENLDRRIKGNHFKTVDSVEDKMYKQNKKMLADKINILETSTTSSDLSSIGFRYSVGNYICVSFLILAALIICYTYFETFRYFECLDVCVFLDNAEDDEPVVENDGNEENMVVIQPYKPNIQNTSHENNLNIARQASGVFTMITRNQIAKNYSYENLNTRIDTIMESSQEAVSVHCSENLKAKNLQYESGDSISINTVDNDGLEGNSHNSVYESLELILKSRENHGYESPVSKGNHQSVLQPESGQRNQDVDIRPNTSSYVTDLEIPLIPPASDQGERLLNTPPHTPPRLKANNQSPSITTPLILPEPSIKDNSPDKRWKFSTSNGSDRSLHRESGSPSTHPNSPLKGLAKSSPVKGMQLDESDTTGTANSKLFEVNNIDLNKKTDMKESLNLHTNTNESSIVSNNSATIHTPGTPQEREHVNKSQKSSISEDSTYKIIEKERENISREGYITQNTGEVYIGNHKDIDENQTMVKRKRKRHKKKESSKEQDAENKKKSKGSGYKHDEQSQIDTTEDQPKQFTRENLNTARRSGMGSRRRKRRNGDEDKSTDNDAETPLIKEHDN